MRTTGLDVMSTISVESRSSSLQRCGGRQEPSDLGETGNGVGTLYKSSLLMASNVTGVFRATHPPGNLILIPGNSLRETSHSV